MSYRLSMIILVIFTVTSCKTVNVEKPAETYQYEKAELQPSLIGFSAEAKLSDIQKELNREFTGLVYEDNSLDDNGGDNVMIKAWKQGDIKLAMNDNIIIYKVPLKLWIKAGFKTKQLGITLSDYREVNGALALMFRTTITLNPDWTVSTKTEASGYEWITEPVVKVAGLNIPVKFVADLVLQSNLKTISNTIDESVKSYLDLRPYALQAWKSLNEPVSLNDEYKWWLRIKTSDFYASPLTSKNGIIRLQSSVKSVIETMVGQKPVTPSPGPLPKLQISPEMADQVVVNASVDIPFGEINSQAAKYLNGQTFTQGKRSVKVENVTIYGSNGKLVAETRLSGSLEGTIYFSGIPAFNPQDSTLYLKDFDFDLSTKNFLIKSAAWIYQGGFRNMIAKQMVWPLAADIRMIHQELNSSLKAYRLADGVTLNGQVTRLSVGDIMISSEGVKPFISAEGKIRVVFSGFGAAK
ncbi:MAG: DUF4403 family protein [Bacteroidales bacterium]|nr:DUF4403 family protein [Bacteroidales bacterium]